MANNAKLGEKILEMLIKAGCTIKMSNGDVVSANPDLDASATAKIMFNSGEGIDEVWLGNAKLHHGDDDVSMEDFNYVVKYAMNVNGRSFSTNPKAKADSHGARAMVDIIKRGLEHDDQDLVTIIIGELIAQAAAVDRFSHLRDGRELEALRELKSTYLTLVSVLDNVQYFTLPSAEGEYALNKLEDLNRLNMDDQEFLSEFEFPIETTLTDVWREGAHVFKAPEPEKPKKELSSETSCNMGL